MPPESGSAGIVRRALRRGCVRLMARDALHGIAAASLFAASSLSLARWSPRGLLIVLAVAAMVATAVLVGRRPARTAAEVARRLERAEPVFKNLLVTAEELLRHPSRSPDWISRRVMDAAAGRLGEPDWRVSIPIAPAVLMAVAALVGAAVLPIVVRSQSPVPGASATTPLATHESRRATVVEIRVDPPPYSKRPAAVLTDPDRLDALEGSKLILRSRSEHVGVRFGDRWLLKTAGAEGQTAEMVLSESGYLAIESSVTADAVRLVPVAVTPDRAPVVRVERPARDLLLPDARGAVEIEASATDDIGLAALALRYTKVSGSGEQFEFVEGELPLTVSRSSTQRWQARGRIPVETLGLEPGDSLVYRLTARDGRPGLAGSSSSDTFFVEIAGPGLVPLEGFEMPPEQERYALSQQMIVVKLRRLRQREKSLSAAALDEETSALAAEQRAVRGNFVFLMGGHVEDEEEEAEQSNEIQEGRLENTARREISRAVSHMSTAEQAILAHETSAALGAALKAVESLQRAFTRNRYILRTLPSRLRIDPSRRLSGALSGAKDADRPLPVSVPQPDAELARQLLGDMLALMPRLRSDRDSTPVASLLSSAAERALAAAPGDTQWRSIAQSLIRLRTDVTERAERSRIEADSRAVIDGLLNRVKQDAATVSAETPDRLESAWAGEARRR